MKTIILSLFTLTFTVIIFSQPTNSQKVPKFKEGDSYAEFFFPDDEIAQNLYESIEAYFNFHKKSSFKSLYKKIRLPKGLVQYEKKPFEKITVNKNERDYTLIKDKYTYECLSWNNNRIERFDNFLNLTMKGNISLFGFKDAKSIAKVLSENNKFNWNVKKTSENKKTLIVFAYLDTEISKDIDFVALKIDFENDLIHTISTLESEFYFLERYLTRFLKPKNTSFDCNEDLNGGVTYDYGLKLLEGTQKEMKQKFEIQENVWIGNERYRAKITVEYIDNMPTGNIVIIPEKTAYTYRRNSTVFNKMKLVGPTDSEGKGVTGKGKITMKENNAQITLSGTFENSNLQEEDHELFIKFKPNEKGTISKKVKCLECESPSELINYKKINAKLIEVITLIDNNPVLKTIGKFEDGYAVRKHKTYIYSNNSWEFVGEKSISKDLFENRTFEVPENYDPNENIAEETDSRYDFSPNNKKAKNWTKKKSDRIYYRDYVIVNSGYLDCKVKFKITGGTTTPIYEKLKFYQIIIPANSQEKIKVSLDTTDIELVVSCPESWITSYFD